MDETITNSFSRKKKELVVHGNMCWFCKKEGDEDSWHGLGKLFKTKEVKIEGLPILYHEPCAAYCSGLGEIAAPGIDEQEIEKWFKYGERAANVGLKCAVCGLRGATAGCCMKQCSKTFHYTCARIAAFQGKAIFSVASRNVSCEKHEKWLAKPVEQEFMGMWMEGLGGWHGGLHQQAHNSWLPKLETKNAEFRAKWLTASNYPLTLLSPKPAVKLPGPEGMEADALDALASLCAERMDNPEPRAAGAGSLHHAKGAVATQDLQQTQSHVEQKQNLIAKSTEDVVLQYDTSNLPRGMTPDGKQPATTVTGAGGSPLGDTRLDGSQFSGMHQHIEHDTSLSGQTNHMRFGPSEDQDGHPASAAVPPLADITAQSQSALFLDSSRGLGEHLGSKKDGSTMASKDHQEGKGVLHGLFVAPAGMKPVDKSQIAANPQEVADTGNQEGRLPSNRPAATRSLLFAEGHDGVKVDCQAEPIEGLQPGVQGSHSNPLDSLRLLARTAVPSPATEDASCRAATAGEQLDDMLGGNRLNRQRSIPSRYGQEGTTICGDGGDPAPGRAGTRKRPSSAGGSSMYALSGGGGSTVQGEESECEEADSELGIYEPAKKKPKKFRFLKEVYTDPVSKFVPSPPSRHPRPTPTPRLVKKRRIPTSPAPMHAQVRVTPTDRSERPPTRGKGSGKGSITPSGSLERQTSHPLSQPGSPVGILAAAAPLSDSRKRPGENAEPGAAGTSQADMQPVLQPVDEDVELRLLNMDHPTGTSPRNPASTQCRQPEEHSMDGVDIDLEDPDAHMGSRFGSPSTEGARSQLHTQTSTLRERCKPLQIDTCTPGMRGSMEPVPGSATSVSPSSSGVKRLRLARKDTGGMASTGAVTYPLPAQVPEHLAASEEDLVDVADAHLLGSAAHARMPASRAFSQPMFSQASPGIVVTQTAPLALAGSGDLSRRPTMSAASMRAASGPSSLGLQVMPCQDESQLADLDQYGDDGDLKFEDSQGMGGSVGLVHSSISQQLPACMGSAGPKEPANPDQSVSKVNMLLNNIQQIWVPEGMSGPEIAALAAQQNQPGPIHLQPLLAQPTTIFTSSNMGMNGAPAMFAPIAGMNPHALGLLPRLPYLPHKMMSFANGLTPTGRPSRSTRCAVCIIQKKGKCGTEQAPKNCLRRNQNLLGLGNGFGPAAGMHPIQFHMQHPAMLQVQGGQVVASPLVSPLVSPLPSPLPSPSNQFGSVLLQQQQMGGVSNAMLMQTPHGLQIAGGFNVNVNSRQQVPDRLLPQHLRGGGVHLGGSLGSNLSGAMLSDQVLDLAVNGTSLRGLHPGNTQGGPRRDHLAGSNHRKSAGGPGPGVRGMPDDGFGGGLSMSFSQGAHFIDPSNLDNAMDDFQGVGAEWPQDSSGLNIMGSRISPTTHHLLHVHEMMHDDIDHDDVPGPESPFPRAQDRIQVFSGCVDMLPPLATGEERVLGITMHPRYAARFHAHMRSEAGVNAPLVAVPHNTAAFLTARNIDPQVVVDSLRGLIQESLNDPDVQPRFGLPDDLPVRGVDRFIVPTTDTRRGVHGQWGLRTNEDVVAGTAIGAYGSYAMFREDHERFATNPPPSYRSVAQATSHAVLDASWELLVESNAVSSTLPASLGTAALGPASRGLGEEEVVMCALGYGNLTALANDPTIDPFDGIEGVKENTHVLMFLIHGWPLPIMVTLKDLPAHTEVLYSYGQAYWDLIAKCQQQLEELRG